MISCFALRCRPNFALPYNKNSSARKPANTLIFESPTLETILKSVVKSCPQIIKKTLKFLKTIF